MFCSATLLLRLRYRLPLYSLDDHRITEFKTDTVMVHTISKGPGEEGISTHQFQYFYPNQEDTLLTRGRSWYYNT